MDILKEWQNLSAEMQTTKQSEEVSVFTLDVRSKDILQDLLYKLKWKLRWIRIIDLPLLAVALFSETDLKILLLAVFVLYELSYWMGKKEFNKIKTTVDYTSDTKNVLENNLCAISKILYLEKIWGYLIAPLAGPIGFLCYKLYVHKSFETVFALPNIYLHLALLIPLGIFIIVLGNIMNRSLFKEQIANLNEKIKELSNH
ncbi:hypothetical protein [Sphingobacterium psychroaquaticum]|uniref:Uncharacterized protein n=1 Tax=Sphingobacterium psychroaquaticum TaxID=561061 RepID=A0A1X7KPW3_9SPHI|nr:hypothetical protein [Sphingobacterium psychroaquaticum]QBQ40530.1 hypothetical protein E2P86_04935 [Sphingobacterium psychroaquaticum]SMG43268.1 hypothetical protein SAMN05660862_3073 [Sphingobacterium psychroaquaticum]